MRRSAQVLVVLAAVVSASAATAEEPPAKQYSRAFTAASKGQAEGFLALLDVAEAGRSAELSEAAYEQLQCLILKDAPAWIRAFAKAPPERFERYVAQHRLVFLLPPYCSATEREYERAVIAAMERFQGTEPEMAIRDRVLRYFREAPIAETD